jgi:hypothetical protein
MNEMILTTTVDGNSVDIPYQPEDHELFFADSIPEQLFRRISNRISQEEKIPIEDARQILDGALGYLLLAARSPQEGFPPSAVVDIGWHTFILYTHDYAEFCERVAGHFIHHCPSDGDDFDVRSAKTSRDTVEAMIERHIPFHPSQWVSAYKCCGPGGPDSCKPRCGKCLYK